MENRIRYGDTIWPIAHFFWGYSIMLPLFLILLWLVTRDVKVANLKEFLMKRGIVGVLSGIWAMIPDLDYFLDEPLFRNQIWNDIFFLHSTIDKISPETDLFFAAEILLIFAAVNLFAMAMTVDSFERLKNAIFGKKEEDEEDEDEEEEEEEPIEGFKEEKKELEDEEEKESGKRVGENKSKKLNTEDKDKKKNAEKDDHKN